MAVANWLITRPMLWAADERIFISDTVRRDLLGQRSRHASELLFNGVDTAIFHPGERRRPEALAKIGFSETATRLLFVGRYVEKKGLAVLSSLAQSRPDLIIVLAGTGPIKPRRWGLDNVYDLGSQSAEALAELYRWADLLILPSVGEGYPLVIQEAMACGLAVICGAPADRADPDAAKWLRGVPIDLSKPEASAQSCAQLIDSFRLSSGDRADMARYAHRRYDWRAMAERLITLARGSERRPTRD
jgi:glycosyltransferase involved in cell wall biosynthesis